MSDASPEEAPVHVARKFGTFTGVFTPTLLTIFGVIMYVRLGWVVGNAGLAGAWILLAIALGITACTGLSLSSIATNTRIGAGGPYAMITKSLGLEVGGSIGIPLYLTRPLGVAMYIFGFREGWLWMFPTHEPLLIDLATYVAIFGIAYLSADLAFRVQFLIMAVIAASIVSIFASPEIIDASNDNITWWGQYPGFPENGFQGVDFWVVFAVLFPATTGILAGANMSGDLTDPRRSISRGTLWALGLSSVVYFTLAWWGARGASMEELASNYNIFIDKALYGPLVIAGLLGATFSSALAGAVGGPRILMAMAEHKLLPRSEWLATKTHKGEPRNAIVLTAILTFACLLMRDLNAIAALVTMFFLITYCTINVVLLIESSVGLVSFRPSLTVPILVPFIGTVGSIFTMFIVNPTFGLVAVGCVVFIYWTIARRGLAKANGTSTEDVRSSMFEAVAEWAAARVTAFGRNNVRAWKPNMLVPVEDPAVARGEYHFIHDLGYPEGSVKLLGITTQRSAEELRPALEQLAREFHQDKLFSTASVIETSSYATGTRYGLQALQSAFFRPNILFLTLPERDEEREGEFSELITWAHNIEVGVLLLGIHPRAGFGRRRTINVWVRPSISGWDVHEAFERNNLDLALLMGYRLIKTWKCKHAFNLITVVPDEREVENAHAFLAELCDLARIPSAANHHVMVGTFMSCLANAPQCDLSILGLQAEPDFDFMRSVIETSEASCLFLEDSGRESARA